ncbi:hypothetical protein LTR36_008912 [Oleoguttula mirabilis]|uniref:Transcription initiation factor IIF subunit beta n=1 Tax=Oleoguttula mirabilis TaxID=1507867 RepID=A0AAV9J7G7_9PEZI|nr:hypothetical protein LTR36_008912 [Oleoguttula mirabilis]
MADIKAEVKAEIKRDPADDAPNTPTVDAFDDDTDLHFPGPSDQAWLVKLPKDMWQAWNELYQDAPDDQLIEVGKMRVYHPGAEQDELKQKIQIRLHDTIPQYSDIPKNYDVKLTTSGYNNTVVFAEKDLPGHRTQPFGRSSRYAPPPPKPAGIPVKSERYGSNGKKDGRSTYRTAIPKHIALAPVIQHEANATPIEDDAYYAHIKRKWDAHVAPKQRTTFLTGVDSRMHPGQNANLAAFNSFGLSARPGRGGVQTQTQQTMGNGRKKVVKEKAVRMAQADLIDALYRCFRRYRYWSMKALRNELRQPEAWIKENLENIATLMRSGDFAMNWVLRPEYQGVVVQEGDVVKEEVAKVESGAEDLTGDEGGGDEDEFGEDDGEGEGEGEFEDVKMEGSLS